MFTNGENLQGKNPPSDFKVTIPENPLLSQQAVTSKGILVPYTNLQLNPYPNTQLDLFCSDNLSFSMHGSQYMTNHQLEKDVDCKVLQFINMTKITKLLGYKTLLGDFKITTPYYQNKWLQVKESQFLIPTYS